MTYIDTPNLELPVPIGTDSTNIPGDLGGVANGVDGICPAFIQGTAADRPVSGTYQTPPGSNWNRFYYATDTGELSYDDGGGWQQVFHDTGWQALSLTNGFTAFATCDYRVKNNVVYLRGRLALPTPTTGGVAAFTLPSNAHPSSELFINAGYVASTTPPVGPNYIVTTAGVFTPEYTGSPVSLLQWLLDGISFPVG